MAVTRLERKGRKNKAVAKKKKANIKLLSETPVIKKVDVEKIKEEFKANMKDEKPAKKKAAPKKKEEAPKAEAPKEEKEEKSEE